LNWRFGANGAPRNLVVVQLQVAEHMTDVSLFPAKIDGNFSDSFCSFGDSFLEIFC
jgi:hypothetical protein